MIAFVEGLCVRTTETYVVIATGNIGYKVYSNQETLKRLRNWGDTKRVLLWTHHAIREDSQDLYGFIEESDLDMFTLLLNVSGVGPKTALNILNIASAETIRQGISTGDAIHLSRTTGIGRKTAEKIIFALAGKISVVTGVNAEEQVSFEEAVEALTAIGYQERQIREALKKIDTTGKSSAELVKESLKRLADK
ncbi:MAG TPA: Holliday junction branch migration protein RuvA [Candidatus Paceibacterota bacterium]|nr:Holliday junction branch migration protein RuvA [Candidatus Paceibacterota bacterium]